MYDLQNMYQSNLFQSFGGQCNKNYLFIRMENISIQDDIRGDLQYDSLIDQLIMVGLSHNCKIKSDSHQLKWITTLKIINTRMYHQQTSQPASSLQGEQHKYLQIGNSLYLKIYFCEKNKKPITKLKSTTKTINNQDNLVPYPYQINYQEYIYFERGERVDSRRIIEDIQVVQIDGDRELRIPEEDIYEVIRLPSACQTIPEQNSSNEHLIQKTRYLLIKTLDLDDQQTISQCFQPEVTFKHLFRNSQIHIDYDTFHDFCFPQGVALLDKIVGSGYEIINFILTQEDNSRLYINCLKIKERLGHKVIQSLPSNSVDKYLHQKNVLYAQKAFCIVSRFCYTDFFHNVLQEVFRKYLTVQNSIAIKLRKSSHSQGFIPIDQQSINFQDLVLQFISSYEKGYEQADRQINEIQYMKQSIKIQMKWYQRMLIFPQPILDAANLFSPRAVHCLFSVLSVDKIVEVFLSLLLEKKIFFVSDSQKVLGYVIQSLLSFLYPLKWQHAILPILPQKLLSLLQAPFPLIAGIPTKLATDNLILDAKDTSIIFLDCNDLLSKGCGLQVKDVNHLKEIVKKLRIYEIYSKDNVGQMLAMRQQIFLFRIHQMENENKFSAQHIKHIFFQTILLFLQRYNNFYSQKETSIHLSPRKTHFNFKKDYMVQDFIASHPKSLHKFMVKFVQTQLFVNFIYKFRDSKGSQKQLIDSALNHQKYNKSPAKLAHFRLSQQPPKTINSADLKKKTSLQCNHNTTWSPPAKKSEDISTNYSRNNRFSLKIEDVQFDKQGSTIKEQEEQKKTKGGQICEVIAKAMTNVSHTKRNVMIWTQARVNRLKRIFGGKVEKQSKQEQVKQEGMANNEKQSKQS